MNEVFDPITFFITVPGVIALVNWAKSVGMPAGKLVPLVSMLLGIGLNVAQAIVFADGPITAQLIWVAVAGGVFVGLGASGIHDVAKRVGKAPAEAVKEGAGDTAMMLNELLTGGGDPFQDVIEMRGADGTVIAGPAHDMGLLPGDEVRPYKGQVEEEPVAEVPHV